MGNDFQVIGSKFRAVLFPPGAAQSIKPFTGQQCREEAVFVTGGCWGLSLQSAFGWKGPCSGPDLGGTK